MDWGGVERVVTKEYMRDGKRAGNSERFPARYFFRAALPRLVGEPSMNLQGELMNIMEAPGPCSGLPIALAGLIGAGWALGPNLVMNGKVASTDVRVIDGSAYVKVADVAKALNMVVVKRAGGYEITKAGGANAIEGVTQGKVGDVLFDGRWRFQVVSVTTPDSYTMKSDADTYDSAGLTHLDRATRVLTPKADYKLVVIQCRVSNGQKEKAQLWTAISDTKMNTALADSDGTSHPPVAYDFQGAPTQTTALIPGASLNFPIIFSVPKETKIKDIVYTLRTNGGADSSYKDVRVSLTAE